jgi:hypothetical protein
MIELPNEAFRYIFYCQVLCMYAFDLIMRILGPVMITVAIGAACNRSRFYDGVLV